MEQSTYYIWQPSESKKSVHLSFDVLDRILQDVLRGFALVPKRGAEVGGILLGKIEGDIVTIDDIEPVPCDYRMGPSYQLTEDDGKQFHEAWIRAGQRVVGYYRSDTRAAMTISTEDRNLISRYFPDPNMPVLLVRPFATKVSHAGFFFREDGKFPDQTPLGFPFSRKLLGGGTRQRPTETLPSTTPEKSAKRHPSASSAYSEIRPDNHPPPPEFLSLEKERSTGKEVWIAILALCIALGWVGGYYFARKTPPSRDPRDYQLELKIEKQVNSLKISWNQEAPAIRLSTNGRLLIHDQDVEKTIPLDLPQLRQGHIVYVNQGSVTADLEIEVAGSFLRMTSKFIQPALPAVEKKKPVFVRKPLPPEESDPLPSSPQ